MSSFTEPLIVVKQPNGRWKTARAFEYHVGEEGSGDVIEVPEGFETDFASVPRLLWSILPPDGKYSQAAVLHDKLYQTKERPRKEADRIFREAMKVLGVAYWKRAVMYRAVRMFGWIPY